MDQKLLDGKRAIVTGASRGIGKAIACLFAKEGAQVLITGRDVRSLNAVAETIRGAGGTCHVLAGDGEDAGFPKKLLGFALDWMHRVDILVCCAGIALREKTLEAGVEEWDKVMRVNLTMPMLLSQGCIPLFQEQHGGKIIFISSTAGKSVHLGATPSYGASKAGLLYLTRHLAAEFAKDHIHVNAICPGPVDTEITSSWSQEYRESVLRNLPMGVMGRPEDVANAALFLASDMSDYMTGESILLNGGRFMV